MTYRFHTIFRPEPEGGFTVIVPSLPGCVTFGKTLLEAQVKAKDVIGAYIVSLKKHRESVPSDEAIFSSEVEIFSPDHSKTRTYAA